MKTFQDLEQVLNNQEQLTTFVFQAIMEHQSSADFKIAEEAEAFMRTKNPFMEKYEAVLFDELGKAYKDSTMPNHKCKNNMFKIFIVQLVSYLLKNPISFADKLIEVAEPIEGTIEKMLGASTDSEGNILDVQRKFYLPIKSEAKQKLGVDFDSVLYSIVRSALVQGSSFGFWDNDRLTMFRFTEFVPLYDEYDGSLKAGIRFWKPKAGDVLLATLYEIDGFTDYMRIEGKPQVMNEKRAYKLIRATTPIKGEIYVEGENYPTFPIVPLYANEEQQSELLSIREQLICYDLIKNGYANNLDEASVIYWCFINAGGMDEIDMQRFRENIHKHHFAKADAPEDGARAEPRTIDFPYEGREALLNRLEHDLYRDFMALNVNSIASGSVTATQILAAYEPLDEKAGELKTCINDFLNGIFELAGLDGESVHYNLSKIANETEFVQSVMLIADRLDDETLLDLIPFITPEMKENILARKIESENARFVMGNE